MTLLNHLKEINLYNNDLEEIPKQIFTIQNLQKLYLDDNKIKVIPHEIGQLKKLKFLSVVQNGLVTISEKIKELKFFTTFCCLYDNKLDAASIEIIKKLGEVLKG